MWRKSKREYYGRKVILKKQDREKRRANKRERCGGKESER
jgi:hypothetical protein